jgi:hypothetical protein
MPAQISSSFMLIVTPLGRATLLIVALAIVFFLGISLIAWKSKK